MCAKVTRQVKATKTRRLHVLLEEELHEELAALARVHDRSVSAEIRRAARYYLAATKEQAA